jgi:hypothetical protein
MCFGGMPAMPAMPETPKVIDQTQVKQNAAASSQASGTQQAEVGQGGGSTMLTAGIGIDPASLALGRKSLLGG